jgi:hypothetical protein
MENDNHPLTWDSYDWDDAPVPEGDRDHTDEDTRAFWEEQAQRPRPSEC